MCPCVLMNRDCASNVTLIVDVSHSQYGSVPRQSASVVIFCRMRDLHLAGRDACRRHRVGLTAFEICSTVATIMINSEVGKALDVP
jgi:hypothetical protein